MDKKCAQGKPCYVYMTADANKFLRIYYKRIPRITSNIRITLHIPLPEQHNEVSYFNTKFSTCIIFSKFINLALTFYLQAPWMSSPSLRTISINYLKTVVYFLGGGRPKVET